MNDRSRLARSAAVAVAAVAVFAMFVGPVGRWPWDHDEVQSLMEVGVVPLDRYPGPSAQMERMHRLIPVWAVVQQSALRILPANEWGTRVMPSVCGALVVLLAFLAARRVERRWFDWSLLVMMGGSQTLVWLSQQNRFYSLALLFATLALLCVLVEDDRWWYDLLAALCAAVAVLAHNLSLVLFGLVAVSMACAWLIGSVTRRALRRAAIAAGVAAGIYLVYLRPLIAGWVSGNTGGTNPLVSFVAQTGIPPFALALVGSAAALRRPRTTWLHWWMILAVLSLGFVACGVLVLGNWNPRYALFFMPAIWVLAAAGSAEIAEALGSRHLATAWLVVLLALQAPKLASHYIDGSRHDFRTAARIVADRAPRAEVLSNWPADLQYYLEPMTGQRVRYWGSPVPAASFVAVMGSNAWDPILRVPDRSVTVLGEVVRRRFDEQSHVVRVYRVDPK